VHLNVFLLFKNVSWWAGFLGWFLAQMVKVFLNLKRTGRIDFQYLVSLGGMPSAHTATVCALTTSIGLNAGFETPLFAVALALATIVMFDASTVRRAAGQQARLLNEIVEEIFKSHRVSHIKLKELLGHTRTEILVGMLIGIGVGLITNILWQILGFAP
jgi:acid phosphatase family membrane protein YuiD